MVWDIELGFTMGRAIRLAFRVSMTWEAAMSNDWTPGGVREVLVVYRYEIEPRPAALGGGVRLFRTAPIRKPAEIELGGGDFPSGPEKRRSRKRLSRLSGKGIPGSTRGPALKSNIKRS